MQDRYCILDTETTGTEPQNGDRIIEIGVVEMQGRTVTGRNFQRYLNPEGRESNPDALAVHGLTSEFLADKPVFKTVIEDLLDFCAGSTIVIHNAKFDLGFLDSELSRAGRAPFLKETRCELIDTMHLAQASLPGKRKSLDALCNHFGVDKSGRTFHGALLDSQLLAEVFIALTRSQESLEMSVKPIAPVMHDAAAQAKPIMAFALSENDLAAHDAYLASMAKKANPIWLAQ